jgi:hypothetical protein
MLSSLTEYMQIVDNSDKDTVMGERWNDRLDKCVFSLLCLTSALNLSQFFAASFAHL